MSRVSVVIPTYNRSKCIERAIASVLAQTYSNLEIIVVDDGSTDDTARVVEEHARRESRIRLIKHDKKRGAQAARNTGILAAAGQWIAFLDSDDEWFRHSVATRLKLAEEAGLQIVHSECYVANGESTRWKRLGVNVHGYVYRDLLRKPGPLFPSLLVLKKCLTQIGFLDENIIAYQEWDTSIRLARYYKFGFVQEPTFLYDCRHADSISKESLREAKGYEQVFTKHFWSIIGFLGPRALAAHCQIAADLYHRAQDQEDARRCLTKGFLFWPFRPRTILRGVHRTLRSGF